MRRFFIAIFILFILVGCSDNQEEEKEETLTPYDYLKNYISLWEKQDFQTMYDEYLLDRTKAKYSYEDFGERYEHLFDALEVTDLNIEIVEEIELTDEQLKELTEYEIPIRISFNTMAGPVDYKNNVMLYKNVVNEFEQEESDQEESWQIDWNHSFILPRLADGDEVRIRTLPANRGEIVDRNGKLLATNGEVYEVGVTLQSFNESSLSKLANILDVSEEYIRAKYKQSWVQPHHFVPIKKFLLDDERIVSQAVSIDGVTSRIVIDRIYPYGEKTAHLVGYIGAINQEELETLEEEGYTATDRIGKRGLEQLFEKQLKGEDGVEIYIVKENQSTQSIVKSEPQNGETIQLTIDMNIQEKLFNIVKEERGTAITLDPKTGEITSLISTPTFNPNDFILGMTDKQYQQFINDEAKPNINRFAATYSPGSTIKPISSVIGFETNVLDPYEIKQINGKRWQKGESWGNYHVTRVYDQHNEVDLEKAIAFSDNIYFAMLALNIGGKQFTSGLEKLGFNEQLPFVYPVTQSQISNSGGLNDEVLLADTAYGQGELLVNIVHLASLYGGIINDGQVMKPTLLTDEQSSVWIENMITDEQAKLLQQYLRGVVSEGTAKSLNISGRNMAAKTGTAELKSSYEDEVENQNGWVMTYDQNNPDLLLGMMIEGVQEHGGSGHVVNLAKQFFE
ncbi:penicillin-binding transpeptidase domain-containing protein [Bacillaceae bacterium W0354]